MVVCYEQERNRSVIHLDVSYAMTYVSSCNGFTREALKTYIYKFLAKETRQKKKY